MIEKQKTNQFGLMLSENRHEENEVDVILNLYNRRNFSFPIFDYSFD